MSFKECPKCHIKVIPMADGKCPSCGATIAEPDAVPATTLRSAQSLPPAPATNSTHSGLHRTERPFSGLDRVLLIILIVTYVPLSLWGGSKNWALPDIVKISIPVVSFVYIVFESVRLFSPGIVPVLSALVPVLLIGPSLFLYPHDIGAFGIAVGVCYFFGLVTSSVCWAIRSKKVAPFSEWAYWIGIHSIFFSILALPAIVCGHIAIRRIPDKDYWAQERAQRGRAVGYFVLVIQIIGAVIFALRVH